MEKTLNIDEDLREAAKLASGSVTDTEAVRLGLEALVRSAAYERMRAVRGSARRRDRRSALLREAGS